MLKYAIIFALISLVAGALGFGGVAAGSAGIAKILFGLFLILAVVFVVLAVLGVGAARAGGGFRQIERRAVVDGGANDRQAERDVDRGVERDQLGRDMALIVILRHDEIELAARSPVEDRVAGNRARHINAIRLRHLDARYDLFGFFVAKQTVLAAMGIESRDGDARRFHAHQF